MPALFDEEALKAQAVASRSYATNKMHDNTIEITSSINDQVYQTNYELKNKWQDKYKEYYTRISNCVEATDNLVVKRDNKILKTYYFSMSNGYTENSLTVFNDNSFKSISSPYEINLSNFLVTKTYKLTEFKSELAIKSNDIIISNIVRSDTNHVSKITINDKQYSGIELRKLLNLRSTDFDMVIEGNNVVVTTKGYGHGVGLSQYGANEMAKNGTDFRTIIKYYYNNIKIENI